MRASVTPCQMQSQFRTAGREWCLMTYGLPAVWALTGCDNCVVQTGQQSKCVEGDLQLTEILCWCIALLVHTYMRSTKCTSVFLNFVYCPCKSVWIYLNSIFMYSQRVYISYLFVHLYLSHGSFFALHVCSIFLELYFTSQKLMLCNKKSLS